MVTWRPTRRPRRWSSVPSRCWKAARIPPAVAARGPLTSRDIAEEAGRGDVLASRLMHETARYLAIGAVNLMHTIDPDVVLFTGGMIAAGEPFLNDIRAEIRAMAFPIPAAKTRVAYAELGGEAGMIGAAGCRPAHLRQRDSLTHPNPPVLT